MSHHRDAGERSRGRPRSKNFLRLSLDNPYAQLGVSPLSSCEEIMEVVDKRRSDANNRLRGKPGHKPDDPDMKLMLQLDEIAELIGDDQRREKYDGQFPQNILLTVQPSTSERAWRRHGRAGLISDWLYDLAGEDALLPTPRCLRLWAPAGIEPALRELLDGFVREQAAEAESRRGAESNEAISLGDLDKLTMEADRG